MTSVLSGHLIKYLRKLIHNDVLEEVELYLEI